MSDDAIFLISAVVALLGTVAARVWEAKTRPSYLKRWLAYTAILGGAVLGASVFVDELTLRGGLLLLGMIAVTTAGLQYRSWQWETLPERTAERQEQEDSLLRPFLANRPKKPKPPFS